MGTKATPAAEPKFAATLSIIVRFDVALTAGSLELALEKAHKLALEPGNYLNVNDTDIAEMVGKVVGITDLAALGV